MHPKLHIPRISLFSFASQGMVIMLSPLAIKIREWNLVYVLAQMCISMREQLNPHTLLRGEEGKDGNRITWLSIKLLQWDMAFMLWNLNTRWPSPYPYQSFKWGGGEIHHYYYPPKHTDANLLSLFLFLKWAINRVYIHELSKKKSGYDNRYGRYGHLNQNVNNNKALSSCKWFMVTPGLWGFQD